MSDTSPTQAKVPYKGRPWSYGIILAVMLFCGATITLVVLATQQRIDLVTADYYNQTLEFDAKVERVRLARLDRHKITVESSEADAQIKIVFPDSQVEGLVTMYRPSNAASDRKFEIATAENGEFSFSTANLEKGRWTAQIAWKHQGVDLYREVNIIL